MRSFIALLALVALTACGQPLAPAKGANNEEGHVSLGSTENLPDWLLVARQRDCARDAAPEDRCPLGDIHFNQRTIIRNPDGTADIWVQVRHGRAQLYEVESETQTTTIRFELERIHYRFNCNSDQFVVIERQIMGAGETVVARDNPAQIYRAPVGGSVTRIIQPIACRGA
ncbi:MAG: hypothetical protein WDM79_03465 [Terricaulis sp.]